MLVLQVAMVVLAIVMHLAVKRVIVVVLVVKVIALAVLLLVANPAQMFVDLTAKALVEHHVQIHVVQIVLEDVEVLVKAHVELITASPIVTLLAVYIAEKVALIQADWAHLLTGRKNNATKNV